MFFSVASLSSKFRLSCWRYQKGEILGRAVVGWTTTHSSLACTINVLLSFFMQQFINRGWSVMNGRTDGSFLIGFLFRAVGW